MSEMQTKRPKCVCHLKPQRGKPERQAMKIDFVKCLGIEKGEQALRAKSRCQIELINAIYPRGQPPPTVLSTWSSLALKPRGLGLEP